ncbi:MAG: hypothetical protein ACRDI0_12870 [Actinomycetota bacterium]
MNAGEPVRRVVPAMRWVFVVGSALVFVAGVSLYVLPTRTDRLFAWTIALPLTAAFLGALYWSAALLAALSVRGRVWAWVRLGVPGVTVFVVLTLAATLLHLDLFHLDDPDPVPRIAGWLWLAVYSLQPLALLVSILAQRRARGQDPPRTAPLPRWLRTLGAAEAAILLSYGVGLFALPETVGRWWPWALTPLTARATAAWLVAVGVIVAQGAWENDYLRIRVAGPPYILLALLQLGALARFPDQLRWGEAGPWLYVAFLVTLLLVGAATTAGGARAGGRVLAPKPSPQ